MQQWSILIASGGLWALWAQASFASALICYLFSWSLLNFSPLGQIIETQGKRARWALIIGSGISLILLTNFLVQQGSVLLQVEMLSFVKTAIHDRLDQAQKPQIAPRSLALDHPQTFYIHAPGAKTAGVQWSAQTSSQAAASLGHGLFRSDFNPRLLSELKLRSGENSITLIVDGRSHVRSMFMRKPYPRPGRFASAPENGVVATTSESTDEVIIVRRNGKLTRAPVQDGPSACVFIDRQNTLAVTHRFVNELWIIDGRRGHIKKQIKTYAPQAHLSISPDRSRLALALVGTQGGIQVLSLPDLRTIGYFNVEFQPDWVSFGKDENELIVADRRAAQLNRFHRINGKWLAKGNPLFLGRPAIDHKLFPQENRLHVIVSDHRERQTQEQNHFIKDQILQIDLSTWTVVDRFETFDNEDVLGAPPFHGASPFAIETSKNQTTALIFAGSDEIWFSTTSTQTGRIIHAIPLALPAPRGVGSLGRGIWAVSFPSMNAIQVIQENGRLLRNYELVSEKHLEKNDPFALQIRKGENNFYEATKAGVSCQSCHLHSDSDYSRHDIGQGSPAPTLSVRGTAGTAPYLRGASYSNVAALEHLVLDILGGYPRFQANRGVAIQAYVESLARNPPLKNLDVAKQSHGLALFIKAKCDTCHALPALTNLSQVSESFLFPERDKTFSWLDVPTLLSVGTSAPYLADGRARHLKEIFKTHNPHQRHGDIAALTEAEFERLIQFLEAL